MKKLIFLSTCLFLSVAAFAQKIHADEVPSVVVNTFKQKFPKATDVEWEMKEKLYNVEFEIGRADHEAWINDSGKVVKHKFDVTASQLPKEVTAGVNTLYKGYRIDDAEKIETAERVLYKLELKTLTKEEDVVFDSQGKVVTVPY